MSDCIHMHTQWEFTQQSVGVHNTCLWYESLNQVASTIRTTIDVACCMSNVVREPTSYSKNPSEQPLTVVTLVIKHGLPVFYES